MTRFLTLLSLALALGGCAGLAPQLVNASVQKPSNVALYFTVDTVSGQPVPGLTADNFRIYEDGKMVSPFESKQTILNPEVASIHDTLLLVDMSGSVTGSGSLGPLEDAVKQFSERVSKEQRTAIYAFDGRPEIVRLSGFSTSPNPSLSGFHSKDPSTNLNGGVVEAIKVLDKELQQASVPLRFGTLVIFTDGTDHAARVTHADLMRALDGVDFDVFVIGVGGEIDTGELSAIGRNGAVLSRDPAAVAHAFEDVAARIEGYSKRFYLLSYCSPARAGTHELTVEPVTPQGLTGNLTFQFNADGFGPGCDPTRKPSFDVKKPRLRPRAP